jgi:hypothetical protein
MDVNERCYITISGEIEIHGKEKQQERGTCEFTTVST